MSEVSSVYIHVPFCAHRCGYCDFTLVAGRDDLAQQYLQALELEIERSAGLPELDTLFLGGGTPTHLSEPELARLMEIIHRRFRLAADCEFSVEANPAGLTESKLDCLAKAGVNRLSLGVQSFDAGLLQVLERDHRRDDIHDCVRRAHARFRNVSLDLIFAVPGQTRTQWRETLSEAIRLRPQHLSTYGLTFEKGTSFWSRREKGFLTSSDDELERDLYADAMALLTEAGFEQYEISSFARPGFRCRHNQVYWSGQSWQGFGPGAATFVDGCRSLNHRSTTTWIRKTLAGEDAVIDREILTPEDRARELLVLGLRRIEGVSLATLSRQTGVDVARLTGPARLKLMQSGWLERCDDVLRLTREGRFFYDSVAGELLTG